MGIIATAKEVTAKCVDTGWNRYWNGRKTIGRETLSGEVIVENRETLTARHGKNYRGGKLSGRQDLNLRPPVPKTGALPSCATPRRKQYYARLEQMSRV